MDARRIAQMVVAVAATLAGTPALALDEAALWAALRERPGLVVVMRHAQVGRGDGARWDPSGGCAGETMLTERGRAEAAAIGRRFAEVGLTPDRLEVVSSAMCRTRDTAMLAFGKARLDAALREFFSGGGRMNEAMDAAEGWVRRLRGPRPLVLLTHLPNIDALTGLQPDHDRAVVAESDESGQLSVLGTIRVH